MFIRYSSSPHIHTEHLKPQNHKLSKPECSHSIYLWSASEVIIIDVVSVYRPLGEAFVKFVQAKAEAALCKWVKIESKETKTLDMHRIISWIAWFRLCLLNRFNHYELGSANLAKLCGILEQCHHLTHLEYVLSSSKSVSYQQSIPIKPLFHDKSITMHYFSFLM